MIPFFTQDTNKIEQERDKESSTELIKEGMLYNNWSPFNHLFDVKDINNSISKFFVRMKHPALSQEMG